MATKKPKEKPKYTDKDLKKLVVFARWALDFLCCLQSCELTGKAPTWEELNENLNDKGHIVKKFKHLAPFEEEEK